MPSEPKPAVVEPPSKWTSSPMVHPMHGIALGLEVVAKLCRWVKVNLESFSYTY
jgi:hypothetical protein